MIRPTPPSTLFPYTTLFRSVRLDPEVARLRVREAEGPCDHRSAHSRRANHADYRARRGRGEERRRRRGDGRGGRDRKSTRLNSSHSQISYAVFCLKKKKDTA